MRKETKGVVVNVPFVDLKAQYQSIKDDVDAAIRDVLENTAFIGGAAVDEFEAKFAAYCGASHCVGVGNCTDSLFIAMRCLGIGEGCEVIVPANSFIATSEAVTMTGARVVFCDVDAESYTLDVALLESLITPRTKAVVAVHLYGLPAEMSAILSFAKAHDLYVIGDAAQAHGALYEGNAIGGLGDVVAYSFYPGKNLGAYGDAGAIVTNDDDLARRMRMFKNHGRCNKYDHEFEGVNSRLDGLQAAVLNVKLTYLDEWIALRRQHAASYSQRLGSISGITCPATFEERISAWHLYVIRCEKRDALREHLASKGISSGIHYPIALPNLKAYAYLRHSPKDFPVASALQDQILSLPLFPELTEEQIDYVAGTVREVMGTG